MMIRYEWKLIYEVARTQSVRILRILLKIGTHLVISLVRSFVRCFSRSFIRSVACLFVRSLVRSFFRSLVRTLVRKFVLQSPERHFANSSHIFVNWLYCVLLTAVNSDRTHPFLHKPGGL